MIVDGHFAGYSGRIWAHMPIIWTVTTLLSNKCMREPSSAGGVWKTDAEHHIDYFIGEKGKQWLEDRLTSGEDQPFF